MRELGPLYHWSPRERLAGIKRQGLRIGKANINGSAYENSVTGKTEHYFQDSISFSLDPGMAWNYSHGCWKSEGIFDLWMVILEPTDEVRVSPSWGGRLHEIRVHNHIPKKRLIWIGERVGVAMQP